MVKELLSRLLRSIVWEWCMGDAIPLIIIIDKNIDIYI